MGFGNMQKMMKQVQKMQKEMARVQEELAEITVEASAGGGAVKIVANCHQELQEVHVILQQLTLMIPHCWRIWF